MLLTRFLLLFVVLLTTAMAAVTHVDQEGQRFNQSSLTLRMMDRVTFSNHDDVQHNIKVIDSDGDAEDHGLQKPDETIDVIFARRGLFMVRCAIHPKMKLPVNVQ